MKNEHISENTLQDFVLNLINLNKQEESHLQNCEVCQENRAIFQQLFSEIPQIEIPKLSKDFANSVLDKIAFPEATSKKEKYFVPLIIGFISFSFFIFMLLFKQEILSIFKTSSFISITTAAVSTILISILSFEIYSNYKEKIEILSIN
jgi:hypothetical protein